MLFKVPNTDGKPPARTGVHPHFSTPVDPDGTFELPDDHPQFEAVKETLVEQGHTPVDSTDPESETPVEPQSESETAEPNLDNLTEEAIVRMEPQEVRSMAAEFDDLDGRRSAGELEEKLIEKVRE